MTAQPSLAEAEPPERKELRSLGARVFSRPPLETGADLKRVFRDYREDLLEVLDRAGWEGDPADLFHAVEEGRFTEGSFPVGGELQWMVYRDAGEIGLHRNAVWAGNRPFRAFEIRPVSNGFRWTFVVPRICANLALVSRHAVDELELALVAGELRLRDVDGREVVVRAGERTALKVPRYEAPAPGSVEPGIDAALGVEEGSVEFRDVGHPVAVTVESGYSVTSVVEPSGRLSLGTPESNPGPLPIRIGEAAGTLSEGARLNAGWHHEIDEQPPDVRIAFGEPAVAPRSGIHGAWILGPGSAIEIEVEDSESGVAEWAPVLDGEPATPDDLRAPWPAGRHTIAVTAVDSAGNRRETAPVAFVYDPDPPELSWGVERVGRLGRTAGDPGDDSAPASAVRGNRVLRVAGQSWKLDSDHTQVVVWPQTRRERRYAAVSEPFGPENGFWVLAEDALCPDSELMSYALFEDAVGDPVLWVEAVDCVGNARRGRWSLAPAKR